MLAVLQIRKDKHEILHLSVTQNEIEWNMFPKHPTNRSTYKHKMIR